MLQKEWYISKHLPLFIHKTEGPPCSTTGTFLPIVEAYRDLLPIEAQNVLEREKKHYETHNKAEDYLAFPKYFCPETKLYMFYHPVKCQWKVINSAEMHNKHVVKAFSEAPTRVIFPPSVDFQGHYDLKAQFPGASSAQVDKELANVGLTPFTDTDFPPNNESLLGKETAETVKKTGKETKELKGGVEWIRAREIHDGDFPVKLFHKVSPASIVQGGLGDCWLLSAFSVVAEYEDFFPTYVFRQNEASMEGRYTFNLFDYAKQKWLVVAIDDYIPCYPKSKYAEMPIPKFCQPNGNEIWLMLLEKAFAKMVGGYLNLKAGYAGLAWMMLTGSLDYNRWILEKDVKPLTWRRRPIMMFHSTGKHLGFEYAKPSADDPLYQEEDFLNYLRKCGKKNYLVGAVGVHGGGVESIHENGLIEGHAYAVLAIHDINCTDGKLRTLVQLRNPWGDDHVWKGAWSDFDDKNWKLAPENGKGMRGIEPDGGFWMEGHDFLEFYTHLEVQYCPFISIPKVLHYDMKKHTGKHVLQTGLSSDELKRRG